MEKKSNIQNLNKIFLFCFMIIVRAKMSIINAATCWHSIFTGLIKAVGILNDFSFNMKRDVKFFFGLLRFFFSAFTLECFRRRETWLRSAILVHRELAHTFNEHVLLAIMKLINFSLDISIDAAFMFMEKEKKNWWKRNKFILSNVETRVCWI